jgi:hypothetical protein
MDASSMRWFEHGETETRKKQLIDVRMCGWQMQRTESLFFSVALREKCVAKG